MSASLQGKCISFPPGGIPVRKPGWKFLTFIFMAVLMMFSTEGFAHAVAQGDKGYIQEISGVNLIAFT